MKLTKEQIVLLNDVFNYALDFVERNACKHLITYKDIDDGFVLSSWDEIHDEIEELASVIKEQIEVVEE